MKKLTQGIREGKGDSSTPNVDDRKGSSRIERGAGVEEGEGAAADTDEKWK